MKKIKRKLEQKWNTFFFLNKVTLEKKKYE